MTVDPNGEATIQVEADPPDEVKAGSYPVLLRATGQGATLEHKLVVEIAGSPALTLQTADERLNASGAAGDTAAVQLVVRNTGSAPLEGVRLSASPPSGWDVSFQMLLGLTEPTSGSVRIVGLDPTRQAVAVKRKVGYLPDAVGFYANLTGRQNLHYTARLNRIAPEDAERRIDALLDQVGLAQRADDPVAAYSRGMLQRLGVADALVKDPDVLILDEPTIGIDPEGVAQMLELIRRISAERRVTVLLSSHLLGQVQAICDRIGIFVGGRLVACGTIEELGAAHGGRLVVEVEAVGGDPEPVLRSLPEVVRVQRDGDRLLLGAQRDVRADVARALAAAGLVPVHLRLRAEELGAIYHRHFAEEEADAASVG